MDKIRVKVLSKEGVIWEGEGTSCSMDNEIGPFDILAQHTQFISPIYGQITVRNDDKIIWEFKIESSALCRVKADVVEIWLGI